MINKTLHQLYAEHAGKISDKWSSYLTEYHRAFHDYRSAPVRLLEIGVQNGGSLEIWSKYFPHAKKIIGCDINPDCTRLKYEDSRIAVIVGDANSDATLATVLSAASEFDLIIDDGSHRSGDIIKSFALYFPRLTDDGIFVVEDLHCSYWKEFEGGLFDPLSSVAFFKRIADILSREHWGVDKKSTDILEVFFAKYDCRIDAEVLQRIHSVEFINSMCIIRKAKPEHNRLGPRNIAGAIELIVPGHLELRSTEGITPEQTGNEWTMRNISPEEELPLRIKELSDQRIQVTSLNKTVAERDCQITNLDKAVIERDCQITNLKQMSATLESQLTDSSQTIIELEQQIANFNHAIVELRESTSWRLTIPVRAVGRQIRRIRIILNALPYAKAVCGGYRGLFVHAWRTCVHEGLQGIKKRIAFSASPGSPPPIINYTERDHNDYSEWLRRYDTIVDADRKKIKAKIKRFPHKPLISIVMPVYNPPLSMLKEAIQSVLDQLYPHWELCIADDASTDKSVRKLLQGFADKDHRIKVVFRPQNGHISAASNSALELANGDYIALLDNDDLLAEHALFWVTHAIMNNPDAGLIYSDEDKIDQSGRRYDPYFKPDWNPDLFLSHNMICHLGVYRTDLVRQLAGFRKGYEGAQDYDLALRCAEQLAPQQIVHIPRVLYHWRSHPGSTAQAGSEKNYALLAGQQALMDHFDRMNVPAKVELLDFGMYRASYDIPQPAPLVSLIIPTRNGLNLIKQCVASILDRTTYENYEIIIVDNNSDDPQTLEYFASLTSENRIRILRDDRPFNYSALNNSAVQQAQGEYLALINNDIEVVSPYWLDEMIGLAAQPDVGAVGARLWYPNDTLQHGGCITGIGGVAGHAHKHLPKGHFGYLARAQLIQTMSAVTAACLVIKKSIYQEVGGLDEANLKVAFNDVDFCLRVREAGYRNIWTPYAELYHHESATRGHENTPEKQSRFQAEVVYIQQRWGDALLNDPAYNPNLTLDREDFSLAWPPRVEPLDT